MLVESILCCVGSIALWSLVAAKLESWRVSPALAVALIGVVVGVFIHPELVTVLNYPVTEQIVELILATLLFSDAIAVRGRMLGTSPTTAGRLLVIALPISLALAALVSWLLLPGHSIALALVVACIVMPSDMSPAPYIVADRRLPQRVRSALNVESGYNDGIVAPVFTFALAVVTASSLTSGSSAFGKALESSGIALGIGLGTGLSYGLLVRAARARSWTNDTAVRVGLLAVPLTTYSLSVVAGGNGFVAAFVSGVAVHLCLRGETEEFTTFTKDVVEATSLALWFVFGVIFGVIVFYLGIEWQTFVIAALALTAIRALPVALALIGSPTSVVERCAIAFLGPRGITTLVFGLLAFNAMDGQTAVRVLQIMIVTVALSLLLHGFGAATLAARVARGRQPPTSPRQSSSDLAVRPTSSTTSTTT